MLTAMPAVKPVITGLRDVFHQRADAQQAGRDEHQAREQRAQDQAAIAELVDHVEDDRHERRGRTADLHARTAEQRDQKAGDDRRVQSLVGRRAGRDRERHRQRQRDDRDREPGDRDRGEGRPRRSRAAAP